MNRVPSKYHRTTAARAAWAVLLACSLLSATAGMADEAGPRKVTVNVGDYRFDPDVIEVVAHRPVTLTLVNNDAITPHNFTLSAPRAGLDLDVDIPAGGSTELSFTPQAAGRFTFYCNKKLLFFKSHRERGMEGTLVVNDKSEAGK
jgi:plastocyanin